MAVTARSATHSPAPNRRETCHPERSEGSATLSRPARKLRILRSFLPQDDRALACGYELLRVALVPVPLVGVVRMPIHEVVHVLARMYHRPVPAVRSMVVVRLTLVDLVPLGGVKHARAHETAERIQSGVRRSGSSSTTISRR